MFVYLIVNNVNWKIYVGKTIGSNLRQYFQQKCHEASKKLGGNSYLYAAIRKHGRGHFHIHPLFEASTNEEICEHEKLLVKALKSQHPDIGYNICRGGEGRTGPLSAEARRKAIENLEKCRYSTEVQQKLSEARRGKPSGMKGKRLSYTHRRKLLAVITGRSVSEETRHKISESNKGQTRSDETRHKISEANKIRFSSEEARLKLSEAMKNSPLFEDARRKNSEAHKGRVPWNKGKQTSLEVRLKLSEAHKKPKPVFQIQS